MKVAILFLLSFLPFAVFGQPVQGAAGPYRISITSDPAVIPVGTAKLRVRVTDAAAKPVAGATVKVFAQMPGMPMGEREQTAAPVSGESGVYEAPAVFGMAGTYGTKVSISGPAGSADATLQLETGQDTTGNGGGLPLGLIAVVVAVLTLLLWVAIKMGRAGVRVHWASLGHPRVLAPLILLIAILLGSVWAVNNLRRQGSMTPLAAQGMEMNTPAPPGSAAVTVAPVERKAISSTVRYSGQVVGYSEQDVFPRVTGTLTYMPFYVGDKVRQGEILAKLDVSQLAPEVAGKQAMADAARRGLASAKADYDAAVAMVDQASAEHQQFMDAIDEASSNLTAAKENDAAMEAQIKAATADTRSQVAKEDAAKADDDYWRQELGRMTKLYQARAVSKDEYQQAISQQAKARAALVDAQAEAESASAKSSSAVFSERQARAGVSAAQRKVQEAQHEMQIHEAHVEDAAANRRSAAEKAAQAAAMVRQAQADLTGSLASEGYATIRAPFAGVVLLRNATQGTLVQPGTSILRIATIDPVRVQANVPAADLERIRVGAEARIWTGVAGENAMVARVSSVSPNVDPTARTGLVEAVVRNPNGKLMPGQYDTLAVVTGRDLSALAVPNGAIQQDSSGYYVWVAEPAGAAGQYTAHRSLVKVGISDGVETEVLSGVSEGQDVITSGFINLDEGSEVNALPTPDSQDQAPTAQHPRSNTQNLTPNTQGPRPNTQGSTLKTQNSILNTVPTVRVTSTAFDPQSVTISGTAPRLTFLRVTDQTCGKEVVFPELGIRKALPLNKPITIALSSLAKRTYTFTCGLSMFKGEVVVK